MRLTLAENFRAIFYTPFYLLKALGLAEQAGLTLEWLPPGSPGGAIDAIKEGRVDLTWGGPMRVMKDHDTTPANGQSLLCFGEVVSRDPFFLLGKKTLGRFELAQLRQLRMALVSEVPTPWLCLQADLRDLRLNVREIENSLKRGLSMPEQIQALKAGTLDVAQLFEPLASELLTDPDYQVLYAAHTRGPTVYTTLICSRNGWDRHHQAFTLLNQVLGELQTWMHAQTPAAIASQVRSFFPELSLQLLENSMSRYLQNGIWASSPNMSQPGFDRLSYSLNSGGFIRTQIDFASCVTPLDQPST
ncbi:ABC transporter substrate-binding protein [Zwartia panacis]|uniref:ABC transporter substrate-binding protein n=1 Tax=Zwartia panacis TaxID=2683345 RepID=UPI0025B482B3|nr:ABC transporter substrate-binding protein [Zwartia panacis]MDN4016614.1 ABC transporter substrate-binding protein [Zwartia panacis]